MNNKINFKDLGLEVKIPIIFWWGGILFVILGVIFTIIVGDK